MRIFETKQLAENKRVCLRLKDARENSGMSLYELSQKTKISKQHLTAIEECRFDDIPHATIYQKNFLKRYANAIGLPETEVLNQFITEETTQKKEGVKKEIPQANNTRLHNFPSLIRAFSIITIILGLVGYIGWQIREIVKPPQLTLYSPQNGFVTDDQELTVQGKTHKETQLSVNGKIITSDESGQFKETVTLSAGINTITVSAKKKHGKSTTVIRHVTLKKGQFFSYKN